MEAFLRAVEEAAGIRAPLGAEVLRAVLLELERAAGHGAWFCRAAGLMGRAGLRRDLERWMNKLVNVVGEWLGGSPPAAWLIPGGVKDGFPLRDRHRVVGKLADLSAEALELFPEAAALPFPRWVDSRLRKATESPSSAAWVGPLGRTAGHGGDVRREEPGVYGALSWEERESPSFGSFLGRLAADRASETLRALQIAKIFLADHPGGVLYAGEPVKGSGDGFGRCEGPAGEVCCRLHLRRGRLGRVRFSLPEQLNRSVSRCLVGTCLDEMEYLALLWEEPVAGREAC
jgi:Ni,Fe-hydrogenase III large subunit